MYLNRKFPHHDNGNIFTTSNYFVVKVLFQFQFELQMKQILINSQVTVNDISDKHEIHFKVKLKNNCLLIALSICSFLVKINKRCY